MPDWSAARAAVMLDPAVTMLNAGSFGPVPHAVFDRVTELRRQLAEGPTNFLVRTVPPLLWGARERTAAFLGTRPERFVFTSNVSAAINLVASGLPAVEPGEVLLTDHEYGCMVWVWERFAARRGLTIRTFPLPTMAADPAEIVAAAEAAFSDRTRLFFFSHVLSPTGLVLPAAELCAAARRWGIRTVVDGAHAPGLLPLDIDAVGADYYAGNLHKWVLAPTGAGFLALGTNCEAIEPLHVSWGYKPDSYPLGDPRGSAHPDAPDAFGSTPRVRFLEFEGTRDPCPWLAVPAALDFQDALGWDNVRRRAAELGAYTRGVIDLPPATPVGLSGTMTAFELPAGTDAAALRRALWDRRVEIPVIERPDRLLLRVSHPFFTTESELDRLAAVLREVL
ncbi:aminotransferase class V-fold PLP-dependent enzyme [Urbifossiella limnaea]|uniref:Isopenicillin N epimerase n=1 Tax=Urbifossiella limnaea TaxID=2528023 RepID=A0A517XQ50_9BACT|nr:aminotransferase class V-fold PLP-dependent enzyme [Urbifossiella limnaea]QDU19633.1 Isopenicillin N epimerase [Urbifossiella limnaea]